MVQAACSIFIGRDEEIVWLLLGGDKSSRQRDVKRAQQLNREYE
ncbi:MAG: addiction module toxin RelE [Coriobacteriaceae bacterium]|nr:MAG: addiction module toxin RelE [Coriobacteriaceae bacterium]